MSYSSTHQWLNGCIVTAEKSGDEISLRIQDENEEMLCDIVTGEKEALCIAHSLLSVITQPGSIVGLQGKGESDGAISKRTG